MGRLAIAALQGLGSADSPGRVAACGGVFQAGKLLLTPMEAEIKRHAAGQEVTLPDFPPVVGAVFLGLQVLGIEINEAAAALRLEIEKGGF
ncbi:MAG TPA: hypothetical protein GX528_02445 [Firmicutes bacterium]|nr:hypothetical protein [Bacillota bacterium]